MCKILTMPSLLLAYLAISPVCSVLSADTSFQFVSVNFGSVRSVCKNIPNTMGLCHDVGYKDMRLPNLLGHDTMKEAQQQSGSWVPLISKRCHPDTKKFLCSLFAPVCLPELTEPIRPCRDLCEGVRNHCLPVMAAFGFPWPEMFNCSLFPDNMNLCIPATNAADHTNDHRRRDDPEAICDACIRGSEGEKEIRLSYCKSRFVVTLKLGESFVDGSDRRIVASGRSRLLMRNERRTEEETIVQSVLWLPQGGSCTCEPLDSPPSGHVLGLGIVERGRLVLTHLMKWHRAERELKKFVRSLQRVQC